MKIVRLLKNYFANQNSFDIKIVFEMIETLSIKHKKLLSKIELNARLLRSINQKINKISNSPRKSDVALDLYLVRYNKSDGKFMSDYQRWLEGKPNDFFDDEE